MGVMSWLFGRNLPPETLDLVSEAPPDFWESDEAWTVSKRSSHVWGWAWWPTGNGDYGELRQRFKDRKGNVVAEYHYDNVRREVHEGLWNAESIGKYSAAFIWHSHRYLRIWSK